MLKKTIEYTDYNGVLRKEDFYFNLSKAEVAEMEMIHDGDGGYANLLQSIVDSNDAKQIVQTFKQIILMAYGEKSSDGKRFVKSDDISKAFSETEAYSKLFMELATDAEAASAFVTGILPADLS